MTNSTSLIRFRRLLVLAAVVAAATASAAVAGGRPPDVRDAASANLATLISRPPDVRDAASATTAAPADAFERYAASHPFGTGLSSSAAGISRPPDIEDTALAARYSSVMATNTNAFDWSDWAIGIGSGIGLALLLAGALLMGRQLRHRPQTI
jgi:hypothetical protein